MSTLDFTGLKKRGNKAEGKTEPKKVYKEVQEIALDKVEKVAPKTKKRGRNSWKKPDITYTRIGVDLPVEMLQELKLLLATKFYGKYSSQDEMINIALAAFINKHKEK